MENNARTLSLDGMQRRPAAQQTQTLPPARRMQFQPKATKARAVHPVLQKLQLPLLFIGALIGGVLAQSLGAGLVLCGAYVLVAFIWHVPSRTTFTLALLLLMGITSLLLFKPDQQLISNFATYTFVLLIVGVMTLGKESRMPKRVRRRR